MEERQMRKFMLTTAAALLMGALVAPQPVSAQAVPALQNVSAAEKQRIEQLIQGAKQEGRLSFWTTFFQPDTNNALAAAFREHYGLDSSFAITSTLSPHPALVTRLEQEASAKRVTVDVASHSSATWAFQAAKNGTILEYRSPEYAHYKKAIEEKRAKDGFFLMCGGYLWVPAWNPDTLNFNGKSWNDVIGVVPKGRINASDAVRSEVITLNHLGLRKVLPREFFVKLAEMEPVFTNRGEANTAGILTGEHLFTFNGMPSRNFQANKKGAKLKFILPTEGVMMFPNVTFIMAGAPHPNAAKLWMDFLHSQKGQQIIVEREALVSARANFQSPLPEYAPNIDTLNIIKLDWESITPEQLKEARDEWAAIFKR
jgi:iron(III) transport system substrate-binding protein